VIATFYLPTGVGVPSEELRWEVGPERVACAGPCVEPSWIQPVAARLIEGAARLRETPVSEIVAAVDRASERWLDPHDPIRREAETILPAVTGYAPATISEALDHLFAGLRRQSLETLIRTELGDSAVLDGWVHVQKAVPGARRPAPGEERRSSHAKKVAGAVAGHRAPGAGHRVRARVIGPRLTVVWASGNVPVASPPAVVHALLVKSPCLVKTAAAEPVLPVLLARSLAREAPWLESAVAAIHWPGADAEVGRALFREADAIVAFGDDDTLALVRSWAPVGARFRGHGHRVSFGVIGREALRGEVIDDTAARVARDIVLFDQQGCMSPHLFYVECGKTPTIRILAEKVAARLGDEEARAPRRAIAPEEAAAIHQLRATYEMRALADEAAMLVSSPAGTAWTVIVDPDPAFSFSCLNRTLLLKPIDALSDVPARVAPLRGRLQTAVLAVPRPRRSGLEMSLASLGVTRITRLGRAQEPSLAAPHDGHPRLADLVQWTTVEE
jgi:hypothetical protein